MGLPGNDPDLQAAIAEALKESEFPTGDEPDEGEEEQSAPAADDGNEPSKDDEPDPEEAPEAEEGQEVPTEYWGVSLEGIPAEQATEILAKLQQQDSYISQLQERLSKEPDAPAAPSAPVEEDEVTDEALAAALGYDPEDAYNQPSAAELKLARTVLSLEDRLEAVTTKEATREVETAWNRNLDELETQYGKLPFDRLQVLRYAVEEKISSPFEVYFKLTAPAKREVEHAVTAARAAAAKKAEAGGVKPRSSASDSAVIDPKTTSLRDATRIAMEQAEKETGLSFKNLFRAGKVKVQE